MAANRALGSTRLPRRSAQWTVAVLSLLTIATALRLIGLDRDLWYDEVVTLVEFVRLPYSELTATYTAQNNHILYTLFARTSVLLFGESSFALRLPAALFGVASLAALYALGLRIVSRPESFLATAVVAVSYHHVWFSQNARGYTGLMLIGMIATCLFIDGMRGEGRGRWVFYGVTLALGMYVHLSAVFFWVCHGLAYLTVWLGQRFDIVSGWTSNYPGGRTAKPWIGFAVGAALTLALYGAILPEMLDTFSAQSGDVAVVKVDEWQNPLWTALEIARGLGITAPIAVVALLGVSIVALAWLEIGRRDPLIAALMALPFPVTLVALLAISFHIWPRYFFPYLGFVSLLAVHGLFLLAQFIAKSSEASGRRWGTIAACGLVVASAASLPANYRHPKQAYTEARDFVESQRGASDRVVTSGLSSYVYEHHYAPQWDSVASGAELTAAAQGGTTWLVYTFPIYMRTAHASVIEVAEADFESIQRFHGTLGDGDIFVLRSRGERPEQ